MEVVVPSWLDRQFVETALRSAGDLTVKVVACEVTNATAAGDNYASDMYRVTVWLSRAEKAQTKSLVVKAAKETEYLNEMIKEGSAFDREIEILTVIVPTFQSLLNYAMPGKYQPFGAKLLYAVRDLPTCAIVMDDLKAQGFKMADRTLGLDLKHSLLVMKQIGHYHAASVALYKKDPEHLRHFLESVFNVLDSDHSDHIFETNVINLAKEVEKWPQFKERFGDKLMKLADEAYKNYAYSLKRDEDEFNVLCHGDLWLNNMMFRYSQETGEVLDVRFVDYQLGHWTSPAIDLHYFLHTSVSPDLVDKHYVLLEAYYKSLTETLSALGYQSSQPSLNQLEQQFERRGLYGVLTCCTILPVVLADKSKVPDFTKLMKKEESVYLSEVYKTAIEEIFAYFRKERLDLKLPLDVYLISKILNVFNFINNENYFKMGFFSKLRSLDETVFLFQIHIKTIIFCS